jgi:hypothetical protein
MDQLRKGEAGERGQTHAGKRMREVVRLRGARGGGGSVTRRCVARLTDSGVAHSGGRLASLRPHLFARQGRVPFPQPFDAPETARVIGCRPWTVVTRSLVEGDGLPVAWPGTRRQAAQWAAWHMETVAGCYRAPATAGTGSSDV